MKKLIMAMMISGLMMGCAPKMEGSAVSQLPSYYGQREELLLSDPLPFSKSCTSPIFAKKKEDFRCNQVRVLERKSEEIRKERTKQAQQYENKRQDLKIKKEENLWYSVLSKIDN